MRLNNGCQYREQITIPDEGRTLLDYLSQRYRHSTRSEWQERISAGNVFVDSLPAHSEDVLRLGNLLVWKRPPWKEPDAPRTFTVIYEDKDILAVNKPAGLPTLPGANYLQTTLLHILQDHAPNASPLHRLGRWTSGLVLCARNSAARAHISRQWSANKVNKRYRAIACGLPEWDNRTIRVPIGPVPHSLLGSLHAASKSGKPSFSHVTVLERRTDDFLCDVRISSGRPHQIRIHLAAIGHPLVGDPLYCSGGMPHPNTRALPGDPGYLLHSAELGFLHPFTGRKIVIECDPPSPLRLSK